MTNSVAEEGVNNVDLARRVYERGNDSLKSSGDKESRALLLEAWRDFENEHGDEDSRTKIAAKMPRRTKKRRRVVAEDGVSTTLIFSFNELCHIVLTLFEQLNGFFI